MLEPARIKPSAWFGQAVLYAAFAVVIGLFSRWPTYHHLPPDEALIKVSFTHTGKPIGDCVRQSAEELAKLPPNMRAPSKCPRERSPVRIEVDIDGSARVQRVAPPSGLSKDGASAVYERLQVPAGEHRITVRLNDDARHAGPTAEREATVSLAPAQVLVIDFNAAEGGITLK